VTVILTAGNPAEIPAWGLRRECVMETTIHRSSVTPEQLLALSKEGRMAKRELVSFLAADTRHAYLDVCAAIEKRYTAECSASGDPCLEDGCALAGEICLQPIMRAEREYLKECGREFARLFADPRNRAEAWRS
jgi:hypothetical protein